MAVVYHEIYLPIDTESTFDYIVIKQGDAGTHRVRATLISNNRVYTIPTSGASYFMKFRKPDNNYCLVEATVSDNTISAEVTEEMLRVSGTGRGEFMIVSGSDELKTATFHVKIVKETFTSGDVQSHSDFAPFAVLLQGAGAAASNANTAAAAANAAASLAEQKAQAIPDDYSDLVAEVEEVKANLDTEVGLLKWTSGKYIPTNIDPVDVTDVKTKSAWKYMLLAVSQGDQYVVKNVEGGTAPKAWCITDSSGNVLDIADQTSYDGHTLTIPANGAYLIIHAKISAVDAECYKVGNNLVSRIASIENAGSGLSDSVKAAILACFREVPLLDAAGSEAYSALTSALYPDMYPKIRATFTPGTHIVYTDDALSTLKTYLDVKYYESANSQGITVAANDYTLSGTLTEGTSIVTVTYSGVSTTFTVNAIDFYNVWAWSLNKGNIAKVIATCDATQNALTGAYIGYTEQRPSHAPTRRTTVTKRGLLPYTIYGTSNLAEDYPIPIPKTANKIKVAITPNTQYSYITILKFDAASNKYDIYGSGITGWTQGINERSFTASDNLFAQINYKYDSTGTTYPTEPSAISIEFSEV